MRRSTAGFGWAAAVLWIALPLLAGCNPTGFDGESLYRRRCDGCHGVDGSGGIRYLADEGANLLDETWKYGGPNQIERTLLEKQVFEHPDWDLTEEQARQLEDFIISLRGERY